MRALVGWAVDDAQWVLGDQSNTDFLPWAGAFAAAWGFIAAKSGAAGSSATALARSSRATFLIVVVGSQSRPRADGRRRWSG